MGIEIERKFLLRSDAWRGQGDATLLRQGYLSSQAERVVRVRIEDGAAVLTIKGRNTGASRGEWEYPLPVEDAQVFLDQLCEQPIIEKYRHRVVHEGMTWEIDEFLGVNAGLVVAEIELESEEQAFARPDWLGEEVTDDARYYNANLIAHPYSQW
jgi:CYTH domain-containing protein